MSPPSDNAKGYLCHYAGTTRSKLARTPRRTQREDASENWGRGEGVLVIAPKFKNGRLIIFENYNLPITLTYINLPENRGKQEANII